MPAARFFLALGLVTLLLLGAVAVPWMAPAAIAFDALLLLALLVDTRRAAMVPLEATRRWPPVLVQGRQSVIEVRLRTAATERVTVHLRDGLHPGLASRPARWRGHVSPGAETVWRHEIVPRRRGGHPAGPLTVRVLGPWRLAWAQRDLIPSETRRVYPQLRWEGRVGQLLALAHRRELGQSPMHRHGLGTEPYALREYRSGDPPTKIHWKATARHGRLVSREETWERGARLVILLDCARAMTSRDGARSKLDHALATALALTRVAVGRGDRVTLVAFSDRIERLVRVRGGARAISQAYSLLFDLEARLVEPAYDLAAETASDVEARQAVVVLLTSVVDLAAAEALRDALLILARKNRPILVNLEDPELAALASGAPETVEEAFAKTSSLEILLENRRLARRLRRGGIRVTTTPADRLAIETLEAYLSLLRPLSGISRTRSL